MVYTPGIIVLICRPPDPHSIPTAKAHETGECGARTGSSYVNVVLYNVVRIILKETFIRHT
jgi:hypothetical protein